MFINTIFTNIFNASASNENNKEKAPSSKTQEVAQNKFGEMEENESSSNRSWTSTVFSYGKSMAAGAARLITPKPVAMAAACAVDCFQAAKQSEWKHCAQSAAYGLYFGGAYVAQQGLKAVCPEAYMMTKFEQFCEKGQ